MMHPAGCLDDSSYVGLQLAGGLEKLSRGRKKFLASG